MTVRAVLARVLARIFRIGFRVLKWSCFAIGAAMIIGTIVALILGGFAARYIFSNRDNLPNIQSLVSFDVPQIGVIYDSEHRPIINLANEYRLIVRPEEITLPVREAFLSAEDKDFYDHNGVDWDALLVRAVGKNLESSVEISMRERTFKLVIQQGASTITDQLIGLYYKNHIDSSVNKLAEKWWGFLPGRYLKKIEELRLAIWLEENLIKPEYFGSKQRAKDEILARFLSYTYFRKVYGIKAASLYYFGKSAEHLNHGEAALLAGIIKNPGLYAPILNPSNNLLVQHQINRRNSILDLMVENGYLAQKQADEFKEAELPVPEDKRDATDAPSVVGDVLAELRSTGVSVDKLFNGEIQVYSVSDLGIQTIANQALENGLRAFEERRPGNEGTTQGSVVVLRNSDAAILAEVGGRSVYKDRSIQYADFNRVRHSLRQPGSAFKPFVYLAAIKSGWTLESEIRDGPIAVPMGWIKINGKWIRKPPKWIQNYDGKFKGFIPLRKALAESRNAATVRLARIIGVDKVTEVAQLLGIKTELAPYITTAIGASEVNLLELANAYRAIASGILAKPYVIDKVSDNSGNVIFKASPKTVNVPFSEVDLASIQEGLRGIVRIPGGTAYSLTLENFPIPVMGKTGTTNDFRDALFIGSTYGVDGVTVAIRIGYDDNRELGDKETGGRTALPIFKEIMLNIYKNNLAGPVPEFPEKVEKNIDVYLKKP